MVKTYDRWGPTQAFGLICSASSCSVYDGKLAFVPALEDVLVWDVKKGQLLSMWHESGHRAEVTCIVQSPHKTVFAVGYMDGSIRLWDSESGTSTVVLNGHKKSITSMCFDPTGQRLASGSQDTDIIVWDIVGETGLYRLRGHRDQITGMRFLREESSIDGPSTSNGSHASPAFLVTCAKDTFVKLWDLTTQHCVQTVVAHRSEVWSLDVDPTGTMLLTGSGEGEVKAWKLNQAALANGIQAMPSGELTKMILPLAVLPISSRHRVSQIAYHPTEPYLAIQSQERAIDVFRIRTEEEIRKKQARRQKRAKEKKKAATNGADSITENDADNIEKTGDDEIQLVDLYTPYLIVRASGKIRSFNFVVSGNHQKGTQIFTALSSNAIEVYTIPAPVKSKDVPEAIRLHSLDLHGHRTDVRTVSISADEQLLATASNGLLKIWNMKTMACVRTFECGHAICSNFLPGDRQVIVGTKSGQAILYDLSNAAILETTDAHTGTVWSLNMRPDFGGMVTGSADKDVKFWDFEDKVDPENASRKIPSLVHKKTLKMTDEVLAVKYSPNGRFLAVALLDATVKIFYQDTLKFFLSLYGHKLPVLCLDISSDSKLIITSSADKNVKIWGMDFGDCHKSIFAHDESIMQVVFEPRTHNFFSVSKDKWVKYWDGDKFELIQKLDGHHGEIWAAAMGRNGKVLVTGSHDKSIRFWENTEEPLFLEEEREKEMESMYEGGIADILNREDGIIGSGAEGGMAVGEGGQAETTMVQKHTMETLMAGEKIIEALELADAEAEAQRKYAEALEKLPLSEREKIGPPARNPVLIALDLDPETHVLRTIEKVHASALYDALLVIPFSKVTSLFHYMDVWASHDTATTLISNILSYLLRIHASQIVATRSLRPLLLSLRSHLRVALMRQRAQIGYNLAALKYIKRQEEDARTADFYERNERQEWAEDEIQAVKERIQSGESRKRKRVSIKA